jgi:hypothetical protein
MVLRLLPADRHRSIQGDNGLCCRVASTADQQIAETFIAVNARPNPRLFSVGLIPSGPYVTNKGFESAENHRRW